MKRFITVLSIFVAMATVVPSCTKEEIDTSKAYPNELFPAAYNYIPWTVFGDVSGKNLPWPQFWNGYLSETKNSEYGRLANPTKCKVAASIYKYPLNYLDRIIQLNEDPETKDLPDVLAVGSNKNQIAVAKTLAAYFYMFLTDMTGPVVLSNTFQGKSEEGSPVYEPQGMVFKKLNDILNDAYLLFDTSSSLNYPDLIYSGDITKWKKFNASLRMLLAIKLCDVDPAIGKTRFAKAYNDGGMTSVNDDFAFCFGYPVVNPLNTWCASKKSKKNIVPNMVLVEKMKELEDPRMFCYFDIEGYKGERSSDAFPRDEYSSFYGLPFGLASASDIAGFDNCVSSINSKLLAPNATIPVITAAQVLLTEAEAAYRGWISADAKALYETGINSSFRWWDAENVKSYVSSYRISYRGGDEGLKQIVLQRWIASYLSDGIEAWSDWRRMNVMDIPVGPAAIENGIDQYPYRLGFYIDSSSPYTSVPFDEALNDLRGGEDNNTSRMWWDVVDNNKVALTPEQCTPPTITE